uniref:Histamine N-methyltransferase-like n=1 Tax=Saccoglossus kowalevskii TaxID=10224 RepID=A0ABM0M3V1_SACKO|nr:PREDICTED: histamine N-methyltransferase-like [Saccoglossus kowalevskii]
MASIKIVLYDKYVKLMLFPFNHLGSFGKLMKMYRKLEGCSQSLLTSDDLKSHLNRCSNVVFDQVVYREDPYDISDVFDESSNEGNLLLDFLVQRSGFRKCAPSDDQEKVLTFLKDNSVFENGKYWFRCDEEDVVAMK